MASLGSRRIRLRPGWCRGRSRFEVSGAGRQTAEPQDLLVREAYAGEAGGKPRAEGWPDAFLVPDRVTEDLADFLFRATAMAPRSALEPGFYFIIEVTDQELSHA